MNEFDRWLGLMFTPPPFILISPLLSGLWISILLRRRHLRLQIAGIIGLVIVTSIMLHESWTIRMDGYLNGFGFTPSQILA